MSVTVLDMFKYDLQKEGRIERDKEISKFLKNGHSAENLMKKLESPELF
jgi:hypothetical protein